MTAVTEYAYAKINLTLDLVGRDARGYHLLSSVFSEISLADEVTLFPVAQGISLECDMPGIPVNQENLCWRAAGAFFSAFGCSGGVKIRLRKRIPVRAGLGGGSSDAAAVLKLLCRRYGVPPTDDRVFRTAVSLGADVPFFLRGGCCLAEGIGERLQPLPSVNGFSVLIAQGAEGADTPAVYRRYDAEGMIFSPKTPEFLRALQSGTDPSPFVSNHLAAAAEGLCPSVFSLKEQMRAAGACASEVTGSGSAVYGLFRDRSAAEAAREKISADFCEVCAFR